MPVRCVEMPGVSNSPKDPLQPQVNGNAAPEVGALWVHTIEQISHDSKDPGREWFIDKILPEGACLMVGRPKIGKSWLLLQLATCVAGCAKFLGYDTLGAFDVLYVASEDDASRIRSRLDTMKLLGREWPARIHFMLRDDLTRLAAQYAEHFSFAQWLDKTLERTPSIKLVIVDTESTVRSAWDAGRGPGDFERAVTRKDYAELREFDEVALKRHAAIFMVNHTSKRKSGTYYDIFELVNRTGAAMAAVCFSWVLADPADTDPLNPGKMRILAFRGRDLREDGLLAIQQNDLAEFENLGPYLAARQTEAEKEVLEALEAMRDPLKPEVWFKAKDVAEEIGKNTKAVQMTIARMKKAKRERWGKFYIESKRKMGVRLMDFSQ